MVLLMLVNRQVVVEAAHQPWGQQQAEQRQAMAAMELPLLFLVRPLPTQVVVAVADGT